MAYPEHSHACGRAHSDTALDAIDAVAKELADPRRSNPSNIAIGFAIENGRLSLLKTYLEGNGLDFTYTDECGRNLLHLPTSTRDYAVFELIYDEFSTSRSFQTDTPNGSRAYSLHLTAGTRRSICSVGASTSCPLQRTRVLRARTSLSTGTRWKRSSPSPAPISTSKSGIRGACRRCSFCAEQSPSRDVRLPGGEGRGGHERRGGRGPAAAGGRRRGRAPTAIRNPG